MEADFDRKLVSYVERHPALYDPAAPGFSDGQVLAAAWGEIARSLEASECVVKARWKDLRRGFRRAYREVAPPCARHPRSCVAFPFFESMLWLAPYIRRKRCSATLKIRKCPVHGFIGEQMSRRGRERRTGSASSETSALSSSSYFTETSCGRALEGRGPGHEGGRGEGGRALEGRGPGHEGGRGEGGRALEGRGPGHEGGRGEEGRGGSRGEGSYVRKRRGGKGQAESKHADPAQERSCDNPNTDQNKQNKSPKQDDQNPNKVDSLHKQFNLDLSHERKNESTQTEHILLEKDSEEVNKGLPSMNAACQGLLNADMNFMLSIISDMQLIPCKKRIIFKREVMQLLEKYVLS